MKATHLIFTEDGDVFKTSDPDIVTFASSEGLTAVVDLAALTMTIGGGTSDIDEADPDVWRDEDEDEEESDDE